MMQKKEKKENKEKKERSEWVGCGKGMLERREVVEGGRGGGLGSGVGCKCSSII